MQDPKKGKDQQKLKDFLHENTLCAEDHKWLPVSLHYDQWGVLDRETYEVMTKNGEEVVNKILAPRNPADFSECR